jgi:hypothetical protein
MLSGIYAAEDTTEADVVVSYIADFINGGYLANGIAVAAADVVANPELIGVDGLKVGLDNDYEIVPIIGDFLTVLLTANWTFLVEFELTDGFVAAPVYVIDDAGGADFKFAASFNGDYPTYVWDSVESGSLREAIDENARGAGIHQIAVTRTQTKLAISIDHEPVISNTTDVGAITGTVAAAQFGGDTYAWNDDIRIRYFEVRPVPVSDAVLRTLAPTELSGGLFLAPSLFVDGDTFYAPTVSPGSVTLTPSLFVDGDTFYGATVTNNTQFLLPSLFTDGDTFYGPTVAPGAVTLTPSLFTDGDTFHAATVTAPSYTDTYAQALNGDSNAWNGSNLRQWFAAAALSTSGSKVRITIEGGSTEGAQISAMYIGHAAGSGDAYDFDGTQVQVTSGGNTTFTVGAGSTLVLDPVTYAFDETKAFIVAAHFNNSAADNLRGRTGLGANINAYFKLAANETSTSNVSTYTSGSGNLRLVNRIEVLV